MSRVPKKSVELSQNNIKYNGTIPSMKCLRVISPSSLHPVPGALVDLISHFQLSRSGHSSSSKPSPRFLTWLTGQVLNRHVIIPSICNLFWGKNVLKEFGYGHWQTLFGGSHKLIWDLGYPSKSFIKRQTRAVLSSSSRPGVRTHLPSSR